MDTYECEMEYGATIGEPTVDMCHLRKMHIYLVTIVRKAMDINHDSTTIWVTTTVMYKGRTENQRVNIAMDETDTIIIIINKTFSCADYEKKKKKKANIITGEGGGVADPGPGEGMTRISRRRS